MNFKTSNGIELLILNIKWRFRNILEVKNIAMDTVCLLLFIESFVSIVILDYNMLCCKIVLVLL